MNKLSQPTIDSIRSSIVIASLPQALEEIVLNSLDAGSTGIDIQVNSSNFSFAVIDNGCGIAYEDLIILGERYSMFYSLNT